MMTTPVDYGPGLYWHVHDRVLVEHCYGYQGRVDYILREKPASEHETRLRLFQPVRGALPGKLGKICAQFAKACVQMEKASVVPSSVVPSSVVLSGVKWAKIALKWGKAEAERAKACAKYAPEIEALHAEECLNCPWDGTTIFPRKVAA